jgi:hypothetical protein
MNTAGGLPKVLLVFAAGTWLISSFSAKQIELTGQLSKVSLTRRRKE